ncbi:MAG: hypothetical protein CR974_01450 [Gammaproteobacteria bacterium]|nr:MAG: hypothetical protein CR974_01450 [Gammaproteobacteria bacterium]
MSWQQQRERGNAAGIRLALGVYRWLGKRFCYAISYPAMVYFYWSNAGLRRALADYYRQLRGLDSTIAYTPFANVKQFGFGIIDRLDVWLGRTERLNITRHNHHVLLQQAESGQGGVIFASHLGNFELSRAAGRERLPVTLNVIVDYANAEKINSVMQAVNQDFLANVIAVEHIDMLLAMQLKEKVDAGEFVVISADRVNQKSAGHSLAVPFLGRPAAFPTGPYILAKILGCPVFSLYAFRHSASDYEVYFHRLFERVTLPKRQREAAIKDYMRAYAQQLESYCRKYPQQWFNFYDFWG